MVGERTEKDLDGMGRGAREGSDNDRTRWGAGGM